MSRRKAMMLGIGAAMSSVALVLTGCSGGTGGSTNGKTTIQLAWWGSKTRNDATVAVIKKFEKKYPKIDVKPVFTGWEGYWSKLSTQVAGGTAPDVIQMSTTDLRSYADKSVLADMSKLPINTSSLDKSALKAGTVDGKLYAIPSGMNTPVMMYDPAILKKAGVSIDPTQQLTWTKFAKLAQKIHKSDPKVYGTPNDMDLFHVLKLYVRNRGQDFYSADGKSLGFSKSVLRDWFNYWMKLQKEGVAPSAEYSASYAYGEVQKFPIVKKKTAFDFGLSNQFTTFAQLANRPLKMTLVPKMDNGKNEYFLTPNMFWSISAKTESAKASAKLVDFLLHNKSAIKKIGTDRGIPINAAARKQLASNASGDEKSVIDFVSDVKKTAGPPLPVLPAGSGHILDLLHSVGQKVEFGKLTTSEGVDEFFSKAKSILQKG
ncbi:ABC transporter substrate-binding protein [Spelaeicoccus albus]|uniref:Multiple sugar transport system substrate-binding protein n=1 Tax=Spelaeicoccus albus TaxID=1280376 RepID=A0A7Z0ABP4_9MICO|nr:ABC transporter substrate-binding protein [Spelaeicoccus albus]NYI66718.1 multiple sugar transport system substrate-binding protein [Spelaeicoccus albus]